MVVKLDRLPPYNRTQHINRAVATYLEVQGRPKNRYGVDCAYLKDKMAIIMRDMDNCTGAELARGFASLMQVAAGSRVDEHA
jgi:hypothetical protein